MALGLPQRNAMVDLLVDMLLAVAPGERITNAEMIRATNLDLTGRQRHVLASARRVAQREHKLVFATIVGVGLQRSHPRELVLHGRRQAKAAGRAAYRGMKIMRTAEVEMLTRDERLAHDACAGVLSAIRRVSRQKQAEPAKPNRDPVGTGFLRKQKKEDSEN